MYVCWGTHRPPPPLQGPQWLAARPADPLGLGQRMRKWEVGNPHMPRVCPRPPRSIVVAVFCLTVSPWRLQEQATGARSDLLGLYVPLFAVYTFLFPYVPACLRCLGAPGTQWPYPWRWDTSRIRQEFPKSDMQYLNLSSFLFSLTMGFVIADTFALPRLQAGWVCIPLGVATWA